jgi:hypothetical protein
MSDKLSDELTFAVRGRVNAEEALTEVIAQRDALYVTVDGLRRALAESERQREEYRTKWIDACYELTK